VADTFSVDEMDKLEESIEKLGNAALVMYFPLTILGKSLEGTSEPGFGDARISLTDALKLLGETAQHVW
jgi:hypothetical protein